MQKFIHDNEQYVLEVKRKHGKTKIDKELNDYMRKKNINNNISLFNNTANNSMNNNNLNYQLMSNPLLAMNYLLLQNQLLMQQRNQNLENAINNNINLNNGVVNINENEKESQIKNVQESLEKNEGNEIKNDENAEANKKEIIKKIIEAITVPNNISIEESQNDPRKKGK